MSNNTIQKFIKQLLKIENDIAESDRTVAAAPPRDREDHSVRRDYFDNMIEAVIDSDGSGQVRRTDYGSEFINSLNSVSEAVSSLLGIIVAYDPRTVINLAGRGPLTPVYDAVAFKMLVKSYIERIKYLSTGGSGDMFDDPDDSMDSLSGDGGENSEEQQGGRTARVMQELNRENE